MQISRDPGAAGVASAAVLNWSGSARVLLADYPPGELRGGGVATINGSAGGVPAHLSTLRLAESRGQVKGTFTRIVTDPDVFRPFATYLALLPGLLGWLRL